MTAPAAHHTLVWLEDGVTRLAAAPAAGGALAGWWRSADGTPLLRSASPPVVASAGARALAQYPLVPWSNRIDQGGYHDEKTGWTALAPNTPHPTHAVHGSGWQQPWNVMAQASDQLHLRLESATPFAYTAEQVITLRDGRLDIVLTATHRDARPNWYGLGLHPYLPRTAQTRLQARAKGVWLGPAGQLPDTLSALPRDWVFAELRPLPTHTVDHAFEGWDGVCHIEQPDLGYRLVGRSEGADRYLLYCPQDEPFFCMEPVTHPVNAHHLPGRPGLRRLTRDERIHLHWQLDYVALGATGR